MSLEEIQKLFNTDRYLTPKELVAALLSIKKVLNSYKDDVVKINEKSEKDIKELYDSIVSEHKDLVKLVKGENDKAKNDVKEALNAKFNEIKQLTGQLEDKLKAIKPVNEQKIAEMAYKMIKFPDFSKVATKDTAEEIANKLETLEGNDRLSAKAIKGLDEEVMRIVATHPSGGGAKLNTIGGGVTQIKSIQPNVISSSRGAGRGVVTFDFSSIVAAGGVISLTYNQLDTLRNTNALTPGQQYEIVDFQTITIVPGKIGDVQYGTQEPLIITAATVSTFEEQAWSTIFPDDIIYYDFVDSTSANPGVLIPNGNMGRINYREATLNGFTRSTHYDFRQVVFYHPVSSFDFTGVSFPITLSSVLIDGFPTPLSGTFNNLDEVKAYFNNPSNQLFVLASHFGALSTTLNTFSLYNNYNGNAGEWTDLSFTDSLANPITITPTVMPKPYFFTFGNRIQTLPGSYTPAADGNGRGRNLHVGRCSDNWSGTVLNNVIFDGEDIDWDTEEEVINGVIGASCWDGHLGKDIYYGFVVGDASFGIKVGMRNGYQNSNLFIGSGTNSLTIGHDNIYEIYLPSDITNWEIGDGMSLNSALDLTSVLSKRNRKLKVGYSNMDIDTTYNAVQSAISLPSWCGIANVVGTSTLGTSQLKTISKFPTLHDFQVRPKQMYFRMSIGSTIVAGDKITGGTSGATGQITSTYTTPTGSILLFVYVWNGTFQALETITAGLHSGTIGAIVTETFTIDPTQAHPSVLPVGGNIVQDRFSAPVTYLGSKGDGITLNTNEYDGFNLYQTNSRNNP